MKREAKSRLLYQYRPTFMLAPAPSSSKMICFPIALSLCLYRSNSKQESCSSIKFSSTIQLLLLYKWSKSLNPCKLNIALLYMSSSCCLLSNLQYILDQLGAGSRFCHCYTTGSSLMTMNVLLWACPLCSSNSKSQTIKLTPEAINAKRVRR